MGPTELKDLLFRTAEGLSVEDARYARIVVRLSFIYCLFLIALVLVTLGVVGGRFDTLGFVTSSTSLAITLAGYFVSRTRYYRFGTWMLIGGVLLGIFASLWRNDIPHYLALIFLPVAILLSSLTQRLQDTFVLSVLSVGGFLVYLFQVPPVQLRELQVVFLMVGVVAALIVVFQYQRRKDFKALLYERARALAATRMAELGQVAGGVAHEVNNPLSIILRSCQQARAQLDADPVDLELVRDRLERIERMGHRIDRIVKALRSVAGRDNQEPKALVSATSICNTVADLCRMRLQEQRVSLRVTGTQGVEVWCRRVEVEQILLNLVGNAADAMEGKAGTVCIDVKRSSDGVVFVVTDTGPGVPDAFKDRIFDPFFTTKAPGKGTGLGLSISSGLARSHGGTLTVEGTAPETAFRLELPDCPPQWN